MLTKELHLANSYPKEPWSVGQSGWLQALFICYFSLQEFGGEQKTEILPI